jgi:type I restriction enzyme, S subunit
LETAQQQLKIYRQAVLKWAFEGRLTNKDVKDGKLPLGWQKFRLGDITLNFDGKRVPLSRDIRSRRKGEFRYYGATEIVDYIDDYIFDGVYLLIGEDGANLLTKSRPLAFIAEGKFWVNNHAHVLQAKDNLILKYLSNYFNSINLGQFVTGSAQPKLTQANLNKILVPLPFIEEQRLIVQEIESRLSVCDKVEETIANSLQQAETLRQSILKKAFEGKLVAHVEKDNIRSLTYSINDEESLKIAAEPAISYKKIAKQVPFPKTIAGISTTDLHAGILAMVIEAHEKSPKHLMKLSHVKGEKIAHLVEAHIGIDLGRVPKKDAAGPDDYPHLMRVESRARKANWFGTKSLPIGHTYFSKQGMSAIIAKTKDKLLEEDSEKITGLINTFLQFELKHAEVVATLYAGWNNLLLQGEKPTDDEIVYESRENWSERKLTIKREEFISTLSWMRKHDLIPAGKGKAVVKAEAKSKSKKGKKR